MTAAPSPTDVDVAIVGARPAGAGTALVLARLGLRVLVIDRGRCGSDALSSHALMRGAALQLHRWGVLPRIRGAGTPPVRAATFLYGDRAVHVAITPRDGVDALYAPRRTVLDRALADAAREAGVEFAYGTTLVDLVRDGHGRVRGLRARHADSGREFAVRAGVVIGADGLHSQVARQVAARTTRMGTAAAATVYGYWAGVPVDGYRWYFRPGCSAGAIPTNGGLTCLTATVPSARFVEIFRDDPSQGHARVLAEAAPELAPLADGRLRVEPLKGFAGHRGCLRQAAGPGWALVGDAAHFKDPLTAHGLTDALIEADYLAHAVASGSDAALAAYAAGRDRRVAELFEATDRLASFEWTLEEAQGLHERLAKAMADEVRQLRARDQETIAV